MIQAAPKRLFEACFWSVKRHDAIMRCAETNVSLQVSLHPGLQLSIHVYLYVGFKSTRKFYVCLRVHLHVKSSCISPSISSRKFSNLYVSFYVRGC